MGFRPDSETGGDGRRARLLTATAELIARDGGCQDLTVERIVERAGISRTTFYGNFSDRHHVVAVAHEEAAARLTERVSAACGEQASWPDKLGAGVRAAVRFAAASPECACLLFQETLGADAPLAERLDEFHERIAELLRSARRGWELAATLPDLTESVLVGATASIVSRRVIWGRPDLLAALEPDLVELVLIFYVGPEEARRLALG